MGQRGKKETESNSTRLKKKIEEILGLIQSDQLPKALAAIKLLQKDMGDTYDVCCLFGRYHRAKKQNLRAAKWLLQALELGKSRDHPYTELAEMYEEDEEIDKAVDIIWRGAIESDSPLKFYVTLENLLLKYSLYDQAVDMVSEIKTRYKNKAELYYKKGEAAYYLKLYPLAIDYFRKCIDLNFTDEYLYNYLAYSFGQYGYLELAHHYLAKAIEKKPYELDAYSELSDALLAKSRSAPELVLTGLQMRIAKLSSNLSLKFQYEYLDMDQAEIEKEFKSYIDDLCLAKYNMNSHTKIEGQEDLVYEYTMFCEFFKNVIYFDEAANLNQIDPYKSLKVCILKLKKLKVSLEANYYSAWNEFLNGEESDACTKFATILATGDYSPKMREGIHLALDKFKEHSGGITGGQSTEEIDPAADPVLSEYGFQLSKIILQRKGDVFGMDGVVSKIFQVLSRDSKNSVILTGPSGVGKTSAIYKLAAELRGSSCPKQLKGFAVYQVSTSAIMAGAKYLGMWQERLKEVCEAGSFKKKVILYFEDIENIFGAGRTEIDASSFSNYLIPRIESGEILVIGELVFEQAQRLLLENKNFERVISLIDIDQPDDTHLADMIDNMAANLKKTEKIEFSQRSLGEVINLTRTLMPNHAFPGKAFDLLKEIANAFVKEEKKEKIIIDPEEVILQFSENTGIPDFIIDKSQLIDIERLRRFFRDRILGQNNALESVMNAITAFKSGLYDDTRPVRSFLFVGPTGVGKTETAKILAEYLFGSQDKMIRLNMSEYNDKDSISRLLGAGSNGGRQSSRFLDKVRKNPFNVVLLDELEKANPDFYNILLQLLDEGTISDVNEKPVYFRSSIIIMTSNIGARQYTTRAIGFGDEEKVNGVQESVLSEVRDYFSPEIYNRFDEVVCFRPLGKDVLETIINREIGKIFLRRGLAMLDATVDVDPLVKDHIVQTGYDPKYGARHIKRAVEKAVALPLSRFLASTRLESEALIRINMQENDPVVNQIKAEDTSDEKYKTPVSTTDIFDNIQIPGRSFKSIMESLESRIDTLKGRFNYNSACEEKDTLQDVMNRPNFWDDHKSANRAVKRFAELNKLTDRIHKWERLFEQIVSTASLPKSKLRKYDISRIRGQLHGLTKELESAELEVLLVGKNDSSDAFVMLISQNNDEENVKWLLEIAGVYTKWAKRRGYYCRLFGEDSQNKSGEISLFMHIAGLNTYGLLKNERGIHSKVLMRQPSRGPQAVKKTPKSKYDCKVLVFPDIDYSDDDEYFSLQLTRLKTDVSGIKIRSPKYRVGLNHQKDGQSLQFLAESSIQKDKSIASDLFKAYLKNYHTHGSQDRAHQNSVWGSIVRTYECGDRNRVIDHHSKIIFQNPKDYLNGKIDSLLLERII